MSKGKNPLTISLSIVFYCDPITVPVLLQNLRRKKMKLYLKCHYFADWTNSIECNHSFDESSDCAERCNYKCVKN